MRELFAISLTIVSLSLPATALALSEIDWTSVEPLSGAVEVGELFLDVDTAGAFPLLVLDDPGVTPPRFSLEGTVRYEAVEGIAYLEMWTVFDDGSRFFSRTLAEEGPLARITGSSGTRPFILPFELGDDGPTPARLEVNLVTEGSGRIWVGPITVVGTGEAAVSSTPTTNAEADSPATTGPGTAITSAPPTTTIAPVTDGGNPWIWWLLGLGVPVLAGLGLWGQTRRTRRAHEQRRMEALDSLRS